MGAEAAARITSVRSSRTHYLVETDRGNGFGIPRKYFKGKRAPKEGDSVKIWTHNFSTVRGVELRGKPLFYKSDAELAADQEEYARRHKERQLKQFKRERRKLDNDYAALPPEFQRRISWFRAHLSDWRAEYESYEMSCCVDAVKIAEALGSVEAVTRFSEASGNKQRRLVPNLAYEHHSGNSFSFAVRLAHLYVQNPLWVILEHGALTPLVGCEKYGCVHPRPADVLSSLPEDDDVSS